LFHKFFGQVIALKLANNAASLKPLLGVYEEKGPLEYLALVERLAALNLIGPHIAWAFEYSKHDLDTFLRGVYKPDINLIRYCNRMAKFHNCFPENPKVIPVNEVTSTQKRSHLPFFHAVTANWRHEVAIFLAQFLCVFVAGLLVAQLLLVLWGT
jgi:hypothetical protein